MVAFDWAPIRYRNVISVLKNPFYAGVYAYGKSEKRTAIVDGRPRKSYGHGKPFEEWEVILKDHHEGYIDGGVRTESESNSRPTPMAESAAPSRGGADGRFWRVFSLVVAAGVVSW